MTDVKVKHVGLRIVLFVLALVVAVSSFTTGILSIGHKEEGFQVVECTFDGTVPFASENIEFNYYFSGKSNSIKKELNVLKRYYTSILKDIYKVLDPHNTYDGVVNLATINENLGKEVSVDPRLYSVLKDAYSRTLEGGNYNLFAGPLVSHWKSILVLDNFLEFDPINNEYEAYIISTLAQETSNLNNFTLDFIDDSTCTLVFDVASSLKAFLEDNELDYSYLDLNNLHDAYLFDLVSASLISSGYSKGYLLSKDGLVLPLGDNVISSYNVLGKEGPIAVLSSAEKSVFSQVSTFSFSSEDSYFSFIESPQKEIISRNLYFNVHSGDIEDIVETAVVFSSNINIVEARTLCLNVYGLKKKEDIQTYIDSLATKGISLGVVYANGDGQYITK
ncbi:MAG: hypothetical protein HUK24_03070 [Sphaerochaetaceae bacterium]|nr:hypothetical protein [Sphaerochaetaceae bacterium]